MLVFDVTSSASFGALDAWRKEFLVQGEPLDPSDFPFIVLGNKTDLSDREVSPPQTHTAAVSKEKLSTVNGLCLCRRRALQLSVLIMIVNRTENQHQHDDQ